MTKADLVTAIAEKTGMEKVAASAAVEAFMSEVRASLKRDENVYLRGFGSFITKIRKEKKGRLIKANKPLLIPAHKIVEFKTAKTLKSAVSKLPVA